MSIENQENKIFSGEFAEKNKEVKESRETEIDDELKAAAAMERADYLVKEVKQNKKQMQNIVLHMKQVQQAIKKLRAQLQLDSDDDYSSLKQDKKRLDEIKRQIKIYQNEIVKMKDDLIREEYETLKQKAGGNNFDKKELKARAESTVDKMMKEMENTST
ncbi:MAG: hypothetical protein GF349_05100 [Candidatus Magasanikbacteria bacterium]|nr:hypothetical protein [Candidatus Magasanikbacteria bacterium]